jgi:hypothetical protein
MLSLWLFLASNSKKTKGVIMKSTIFFLSIIFFQTGFAADSIANKEIICTYGSDSETYKVAELSEFGTPPGGLSSSLENQLTASVCSFYGVYQESWNAVCFNTTEIATLPTGSPILGLFMAGYEHGALYISETESLSCQIQ